MLNGAQTRKYTTGQPFAEDYQVWLAGYWEDFTGAYSLPEADSNNLSVSGSHYGNPLNAEARLNPHYRWSYPDRIATYNGSTVYSGGMVTNDIKELHNLTMAEWLTIDVTRLGKGRAYSAKINNEFLDSHTHSNRFKLGGKGELDNYILMSPSFMAGGKYFINNGDIDSSYARAVNATGYRFSQLAGITNAQSNAYSVARGGTLNGVSIDVSSVFNDSGQDIDVFHSASASTTGSFTIDTSASDILTITDWDANQEEAHILGAEIKSPSRTPFLAIRHTMPATHRINGSVDPTGSDGIWTYTGNKRELHHLRVGDIVQIGKHDEFGVVQEINLAQNKITKLYSLSRNQLLDVSKFKSTNSEYIGGGASENNVDIRKWFEPVITYDGDLNCVADGDTFHLRFCPLNIKDNGLPDSDRISHYIIRVGFDSSRLLMGSNGNRYTPSGTDHNPSHSISAIQFELQPHPTSESQKIMKDINQVRVSALDSNIATVHKQSFIDYDSTSTVSTPNYSNEWQQWLDVDVVMDFTNQRYKVYVDGFEAGTFNFETKPSGGNWSASDLYGYHIDHASLQKDTTYTPDNAGNEYDLSAGKFWGVKSERSGTLWTLIDRVGIVNELTNPVRNSPNTVKAGSDMGIKEIGYTSTINMASNLKLNVIDDGNERQVQDIFQSAPSEWMVILFKHGIDSTQWVGFMDQVKVRQNAKSKTREIVITARDAIGRLDGIMPYWEVGQNEQTISTDYEYRASEAQMVSDNFYFGAKPLLRGSKSLGLDHQTRAKHPQASTTEIGAISGYYAARYDQRTRLHSGNPIQMYVGQDDFGPSVEPDVYNTAPTAKSSNKNIWRMWNTKKIIGFSDGRSHGKNYIIAHCIEHGVEVNDTFTINGAYGSNAFTTTSAGKDGLDVVVKKVIDDHHFCFEYASGVGSIFGHLGDESAHFYSIVTRPTDKGGLGFTLGATSPYVYSGWSQGNFINHTANGLNAITQDITKGLGRWDAIEGRQWSGYYGSEDYTESIDGVPHGTIAHKAYIYDHFSSIANNPGESGDSMISVVTTKNMQDILNAETTESSTDYRGFASYSFKPIGIVPLKGGTTNYMHDPHGLVTVGPYMAFFRGDQLPSSGGASPSQYNYDFALEYLSTNQAQTEYRSQILTLMDFYRMHNKTDHNYNSWTGISYTGQDDAHLSAFVRGNDIDQQDPKHIPDSPITKGLSPIHMGSELQAFLNADTNLGVYITAQSGSGDSIELTITSSTIGMFPPSGWARFGPASASQGLFRWRGIDESNNKLTGVTILAQPSGSGTTLTTLIASNLASISTFIFPVMSSCQAVFIPPTARQPRQQYRAAHASYMHDIASSLWFRMVFGIIEERAAGVHSPPADEIARKGNIRLYFNGHTNPTSEWAYQEIETTGLSDINPYITQYSEYFTLESAFTNGSSTTLRLNNATPPLIDENFKDRRYIDKGSRVADIGTDPLISIPSRANAHSSKQFMNNGGLIFEIENPDGSLDVGVGRSAKIVTCHDKTDENFTHWEIVEIKQDEIRNIIDPNTGEYVMKDKGANITYPGPITLTAAKNPTSYNFTGKTKWDKDRTKDADYFHSHNDAAVSGSRMFQGIEIGNIIFVGNTQGTRTQPVTDEVNSRYNPNNPYGEDRDLVSYRWYRVLDKAADHSTITIFPAEYAYSNHSQTSNRHPVATGETTEDAVSGGFNGWKFKLVRGSATNPNNSNKPTISGGTFPDTNIPICKVYGGVVEISGVKFLKDSHAIGAKGRFRQIRNNFNHIWLNWADMRNDGSADADGGGRQTKFGLLYPSEEQYSLQVVYSHSQEDITELAIGQDADIWELTGTDPHSGSAWSANYSNKITTMSHLHNWESKAGAPIAIDTSKFFNLNTMTNNGRIGQSSGGVKTISDYDFSTAGEAALIDSYWWEAGPHPYNAKYRHPYDPNYEFYIRYETKLLSDMNKEPFAIVDSSPNYHGSYLSDIRNSGMIVLKGDKDTQHSWTYKMGGCFVNNYDEDSSTSARLYIDLGAEKVSVTTTYDEAVAIAYADTELGLNDVSELGHETEHTFFGNWSSNLSLFGMLVMEGYVESPECGTYYEDDKIRLLFQTHKVKSWLSGASIPTSYDINNVPVAYDTATDSYGSVTDGRGKTTFQILASIQANSGQGVGGTYNAYNYMIGRNGKFEFRPSYDSGEALTRSNLHQSEVSSEARAQFTHVRVFYNNGESFIDYPTPILDGSQIKFKIMNLPNTRSSAEAKAVGAKELERIKDKAVAVKATIIGDTNNPNAMFSGGLYGYISTPLVQCLSDITGVNRGTFYPHGNMTGQIIGGRQNAMDGNLDATNSNLIGSQRSMEYLESGSGYHGGGGCDTYDTHETNWYGQYTPYGIHCIEKAVQIVHIPRGTPKVSAGSGQKLRMFITHKSNTANAAEFRLWLIDSHFDAQRRQGYTGNNPLTSAKISYLDITKNGFHEIAFPTSYGAPSGAKMIVSFNKEYCVDLLKYRSNHTTSSKSNRGNRVTTLPSTDVSVLDLSHGNAVNEASAFPLGLSLYYRPHGSEDSRGRQGPLWQLRPRALYYAPTVEIVDDMVWKVGTVVSYNDSHLNLNTDLTLTSISWKQNEQDTEVVNLRLLKDESQFRTIGGIGGGGGSSTPQPSNPPSNGGPVNPGGGYGGIPFLPGDNWNDGYAPGWGGLIPPNRGGIGSSHTIDTTVFDRKSNISGAPDQEGGDGKGAVSTSGKINLSKMSKSAMNTISGKGDLSSENEDSGFLGINRNRNAVKNNIRTTSKEAIGQTKSTSSGSAMIGADGFILPGVTSGLESGKPIQADYHEGSAIITVPSSVSNDRIKVTANVKAPSTGGGSTYTLYALLECIETGYKHNKRIDITSNDTAQRIELFSIRRVDGADKHGNRIKVTIGRVPGGGLMDIADGADNSPFSSLTVKGIEVSFNENAQNRGLGKISTSSKLKSKDLTKGWMTNTSDAWKSKTSDATFDSSGNVSYDRIGTRGSNATKKPNEDSLT
tara:strand:- start:37538 stop:46507 length:8970 start_codon:yes stop_codon:yes gene_type:complete